MTKFTFIFLKFTPPIFHWSHFPSGQRAKQHKHQQSLTEQTYRENITQRKGPRRAPGGVSATTLAAKLSLSLPLSKWHGAGGETVQTISNLPSVGEKELFLSPKWGLRTPNSFVPIYFFSYPEIDQYPESFFFFCLFPPCRFLLPRLRKQSLFCLFQSRRWKLRKVKADCFNSFPFFFRLWRKWDEKRKCNGLPAFNSYPVASYISEAATSVPFEWPLLFSILCT